MSPSTEATFASAEYTFRLNRVLLYIEQHLADDLSLAVLARESCFSPFHFHRVFQAAVGETPLTFVKRVRLERAASMITSNPGQSITQIGLACGFPSPAAFSRSFREHFGASPKEWRQNSKNCKEDHKNRKDFGTPLMYLPSVNHFRKEIHMNVTIRELQTKHVAFVANLGGYDQAKIARTWERLCAWAAPLGLLRNAETIGISFDDPDVTPRDKCRYYACVAVPHDTVPPREIGLYDIPGGKHAIHRFEGTGAQIADAYRDLYGTWLPQSGFEPADAPCFEVYLSTPGEDPEGLFVMDICMPVRAVGKTAQ
jgi:AraC family transcriptional regulator